LENGSADGDLLTPNDYVSLDTHAGVVSPHAGQIEVQIMQNSDERDTTENATSPDQRCPLTSTPKRVTINDTRIERFHDGDDSPSVVGNQIISSTDPNRGKDATEPGPVESRRRASKIPIPVGASTRRSNPSRVSSYDEILGTPPVRNQGG